MYYDCEHLRSTFSSLAGTISEVHLRLVGGTRASDGRIETLYGGAWGTLCDDGLDKDEADIICQFLGYE